MFIKRYKEGRIIVKNQAKRTVYIKFNPFQIYFKKINIVPKTLENHLREVHTILFRFRQIVVSLNQQLYRIRF